MAFLAVHDGLTGLHNRAFLTDHFDTLIKGAQRRVRAHGGRADRPRPLQADQRYARPCRGRLRACRDGAAHARSLPHLRHLRAAGRRRIRHDPAGRRHHRRHQHGRPPHHGTDQPSRSTSRATTILPGASAGIAVYPVDADNANDLVVHADLALYAAKKQGGGAFSFFSEELRRELEHRKQLEHDMRVAIAAEILPGLFPAAGFAGHRRHRRHRGAGALEPRDARHDPAGRVHSGRRKVRTDGGHRPHRHFEGHPRLRPNGIGPASSSAGSPSTSRAPSCAKSTSTSSCSTRWKAEGLPPQKLSLEIVESVILDDEKTGIAAKLRHIRSAGVHLELDDFGTGYASLSHVNPNEIDRLKIDRRFVQNINANGDNTKIVRAITELARGLGISIIAEGAETEAELDVAANRSAATRCRAIPSPSRCRPSRHRNGSSSAARRSRSLRWCRATAPDLAQQFAGCTRRADRVLPFP